ncbi:hypothetical protein NB697_000685 [Xanthomonas sacchari]|nr:hypothetical protein [Xanthomonas sacchari]
MVRADWFESKWRWLKRFAVAAGLGSVLIVAGWSAEREVIVAVGGLLVVPLLLWLFIIPILHWKDRYVGERSGAWGALLALETSNWSKMLYWYRHVLPDWRRTGRYEHVP